MFRFVWATFVSAYWFFVCIFISLIGFSFRIFISFVFSFHSYFHFICIFISFVFSLHSYFHFIRIFISFVLIVSMKDPKSRPVRSGVPFGHRVLNYENRYVNDVGYKAEYYKGRFGGSVAILSRSDFIERRCFFKTEILKPNSAIYIISILFHLRRSEASVQ